MNSYVTGPINKIKTVTCVSTYTSSLTLKCSNSKPLPVILDREELFQGHHSHMIYQVSNKLVVLDMALEDSGKPSVSLSHPNMLLVLVYTKESTMSTSHRLSRFCRCQTRNLQTVYYSRSIHCLQYQNTKLLVLCSAVTIDQVLCLMKYTQKIVINLQI